MSPTVQEVSLQLLLTNFVILKWPLEEQVENKIGDLVDWANILSNKKLSTLELERYSQYFDASAWKVLAVNYQLQDEFIIKHEQHFNFNDIFLCQPTLSLSLRQKYQHKFGESIIKSRR